MLARIAREHLLKGADRMSVKAKDAISKIPDDSLFVLLFYTRVPAHLVEWDRRRRSVQYLGANYALAIALGIFLGFTAGWLITSGILDEFSRKVWVGCVVGYCIFTLSVFIGLKAKQDADSMELAWALLELMPDIKEALASHCLIELIIIGETSPNNGNAADARTSCG